MNEASAQPAYRVLARKYRPKDFAGLIGQEAMVRTLTNAIRTGRLAHAFILTGVRGVGKTTTARIIARALNCIGPDGTGGPTPEPCGRCEHCIAIAEDRHVDVLEMDAASRTGVNDIREVIDGVLYRPTSARYKIYIIDEVHMLSNSAFNALLKTLEEPPEHVKFLFATTEIRKVPVTVLSRCQRFDLRRVDFDTLVEHFRGVAEAEKVAVAEGALRLIARAADGSVRDGLSLLDQAIAHGDSGGGEITEDQVRDMLGLADRMIAYDLFDALMGGEIGAALDQMRSMYDSGADPVAVIQDLLELTHGLTRLKIAPSSADIVAASDVERARAAAMAEKLAMPVLARTWQMLLKGLDEVRRAPSALQAAEMVLARLAYVADLPSPGDLVKALTRDEGASTGPAARQEPARSDPTPEPAARGVSDSVTRGSLAVHRQPAPAPSREPDPPPAVAPEQASMQPVAQPASFREVVALAERYKDGLLYAQLMNDVHLVRFEPGRIEIRPGERAPNDLANRLSVRLKQWTGAKWMVTVSAEEGEPTLREQIDRVEAGRRQEALDHPLVRQALETFPGARVEEIRDLAPPPADETVYRDPDEIPENEEEFP